MNDLQSFLYVSIISADNDEFGLSEEDKQDIISRHNSSNNWSYILEPIKDEDIRKKLIKLFENETD
jgi:hypothetical protein